MTDGSSSVTRSLAAIVADIADDLLLPGPVVNPEDIEDPDPTYDGLELPYRIAGAWMATAMGYNPHAPLRGDAYAWCQFGREIREWDIIKSGVQFARSIRGSQELMELMDKASKGDT